jgi:hypothetical protein
VRAATENLAFMRGDCQLVAGEPAELGGPPQMIYVHPEDGSPFLLPQDDDHAIHMDVHYEVALDQSKPWPIRMSMLQHIESHRQALQALIPPAPAPAAPPAAPPQN